MAKYLVLIGLAEYASDPDPAGDRESRLWTLYDIVFSMGAAWHGNQGSVILDTDATAESIFKEISSILREEDLVMIIEVSIRSVSTKGYIADEEGLNELFDDVEKF